MERNTCTMYTDRLDLISDIDTNQLCPHYIFFLFTDFGHYKLIQ